MRWTRMRRKTSGANADGEVVWSWRPDADAKFLRSKLLRDDGGKRARSPGRARINRKTIAQGRPDVSGASAVNTRVHTPTTKRTRGCGCIGHPVFPAPSVLLRVSSCNGSGAICVAGTRTHRGFLRTRFRKRPHEPTRVVPDQRAERAPIRDPQPPMHVACEAGPIFFLQQMSVVMGTGFRRDDVEAAQSAIRGPGFRVGRSAEIG
jgi:hypothetical protein